MPTSEATRARRRASLYEAAIELFRRDGFDSTTIDAVADEAGVSRRTFFNYFPSKDVILAARHADVTRACLAELLSKRHRSPRAAIEASLRRFGRELRRDHALARSLLLVVFSSPIVRAQDQADVAAFYPALVDKLEQAQAAGELSDEVDPSEVAGHLMAVVTGALTAWALEARPSPRFLTRLLDRRLALAFGGLEP